MSVTLVEGDLPVDLAMEFRNARRVAVDTETGGLDWHRDPLQLCQLFTPETGTVLLRRVERTPLNLAGLLGDAGVLKVLHYAPFDLRFLESQWESPVRSVACTKAASRLLDPNLPSKDHSLQPLLQRHLGVTVSKGAVRTSNWGAEALSEEQLAYASGDVIHLLDLHDALSQRLDVSGLAELYSRVCAYMPVDAHLAVSGFPNPLDY